MSGTLDAPGAKAPRIPERDALLAGVDAIAETVRAGADESEQERHIPRATVEALEEAGVLSMMWPREFGGFEADPVTQHEVIERLSIHDPSAGWCGFIGAGSSAFVAGNLAPDGVDEVQAELTGPRRWVRIAGSPQPVGEAIPVDGGFRIRGRWAWASGIHHAEWVFAGAAVIRDGERAMGPNGMPEALACVVRRREVELEDTWHTAGLSGTGSTHFHAEDLFVPTHRAIPFFAPEPQRGGMLFRLPVLRFFGPAFSGFPQGVGRRALDEIRSMADTKLRIMAGVPLAERGAFQRDLAVAHDRLRSAGLLVRWELERLWNRLHEGAEANELETAELLSSYTQNAESGVAAAECAFRYAGGDAVYSSHVIQRLLRDMRVASQHILVGEHNTDALGRALLASTRA